MMKLNEIEAGDRIVFNDRVEPFDVLGTFENREVGVSKIIAESPNGIEYEIAYVGESDEAKLKRTDSAWDKDGRRVRDFRIVD